MFAKKDILFPFVASPEQKLICASEWKVNSVDLVGPLCFLKIRFCSESSSLGDVSGINLGLFCGDSGSQARRRLMNPPA